MVHFTDSARLELPERVAQFGYSGFAPTSQPLEQPKYGSRNQTPIAHLATSMWNQLVRCRLKSYTFLLVPVLLCIPAFCVLGQDVSSIASDQVHMKASVRVLVTGSYSVHEMQMPTGSTVRQFASPAGTVFAVTWQGFSPDLQQLLGGYFEQYVAAVGSQNSRRGRGVYIDTGDLVVETGGHMRYAVGRAYLRSKVPQGVDVHALQ